MVVRDWYDPSTHKSYSAPEPFDDSTSIDPLRVYDESVHVQREQAVKEQQLDIVHERLRRCFLHYGVNGGYEVKCRKLIEDFKRIKDELGGFKKGGIAKK